MSDENTPMRFQKSFTQQEAIPEEGVRQVVEILGSGRLHRYNTEADELSATALLEIEFAAWQGCKYCLAVTSGGQAIQIALRAAGVVPGDQVLANAYTLAPVPGAIHSAGAKPVFVEINDDWLTDLNDLAAKAESSGAKYLLLSHMRGHICDMDAVAEICKNFDITLIEDCAHTMGAYWRGTRSGNFGSVSCFSTQTYKHLNSGEGGFLTTDDDIIAAKATIMSGSYMLYGRHGASPPEPAFQKVRLETPNCSARLDNLRATILCAQLPNLDMNIKRWNERYQALEFGLASAPGMRVVPRTQAESYVGSSFQFHLDANPQQITNFVERCQKRGVEVKWFGGKEPTAFTSRYDSWQYFEDLPELPKTLSVLATTCDIRVPLTFSLEDCGLITEILCEEVKRI